MTGKSQVGVALGCLATSFRALPPNKSSDCVKTYGGIGRAIGGGFNP